MPAKSGKQELIEFLEESFILDITYLELFEDKFGKLIQ